VPVRFLINHLTLSSQEKIEGGIMLMAMPSFEPFFCWSCRPRIIYAPGVRRELGFEMQELGGRSVMILTDRGVTQAGVLLRVREAAEQSGLKIAGIFEEILQDARMEIINEAAECYRRAKADSLIAVGGGSVLDTAKAVNILIGHGQEDFRSLALQGGLYEGAKKLPPHIAVPTTAGTGCEITQAMVVLDTREGVKLSVTHPYCNADLAMLDPELTLSLPARVTAQTGMDVLTHAIEGLSSRGAQPISDALGLQAIRMVFCYLPRAVKDPEDLEARGNMLIASSMAGMCFINTMLGAVHALAHALGARWGIPHGLANAILLPWVMSINGEAIPDRFRLMATAMGIPVAGVSDREVTERMVEKIRELKEEIGITETLGQLGVPNQEEKLMELAELASGDGQMGYNPRYLEPAELVDIYRKAM
jgi:alcohol dehydrogenase class IV